MIQKGTEVEILDFVMCKIMRCLIISNLMNSELEIALILSCISTSRNLNAIKISEMVFATVRFPMHFN